MNQFIIYNGKLTANISLFLNNNRAFRYGDALFETIRICEGKAVFIEDHLKRLLKGMHILKMNCPTFFSLEWLKKEVENIIKANNISGGGRLRLTVFRKGAGLYLPETNDIDYLIEATPIAETNFIFNASGLAVDFYNENKKSLNVLSSVKTTNCLVSVMASIYKKEHSLDDCILLNEKGFIAEAISSNLFIVKNNIVSTPALDQGCVEGTMRNRIIQILESKKIQVIQTTIHPDDIFSADELFLTNAIVGFRWVEKLQSKRFCQNFSSELTKSLFF